MSFLRCEERGIVAMKQIMKKLKRPFKVEIKTGCLNTSVFGGFDRYVLNYLDQLKARLESNFTESSPKLIEIVSQLKILFLDYKRVLPDDRREIIRKVIPLVQQIDHGIEGLENIKRPVKQVKEPPQVKPLRSEESPKMQNLNSKVILDHIEMLARPVQYVKGVGPKRAKTLNRLNVENVMDLIYYIPREYSDRSQIMSISDINKSQSLIKEEVTIVGKVVAIQEMRVKRGMKIIKVAIHDGTGLAFGVWYNQPYIKDQFKNDEKVIFSGKVNLKNYNRYRKIELNNPVFERLESDDHLHTSRIVPIYPLTEGLSQKNIREIINNAIDQYISYLPELIPGMLKQKYSLLSSDQALKFVHFPENRTLLEEAKRRLIFEDFFFLQLGILYRRKLMQSNNEGYSCKEDQELISTFINVLPFSLTNAQKRVWEEISYDQQKTKPMYRLLQGDVGSGKTVIAAMSLIKGIENGLQGALMAPTEILAEQHYLSLKGWFETLDLHVELITGSLKKKRREEILNQLSTGKIDLVVGTHALIQEEVQFKKLGVVVIDEQHRFGVEQRELLQKKGIHPHVLVMTATPIPRSMALTIYGDLELSVIDELPPGRKPIVTVWRQPETRDKIYSFVKDELNQGRQAYVVCPLIDESEVIDVESATQMAEYLSLEVFTDYKVSLLTGQTSRDERDQIMRDFRDGKVDILVATTVIEVGVDVPNASIMLIEDAQRFGLAQLHQLRGRVGRGEAQSYCILIGDTTTPEGERRLNVMVETNDGFKIAEEDLAIRGPGEFFGTRQHGLPEFKVASLIRDWEMLEIVRNEVKELLKEYPDWIDQELLKIIFAIRFRGSLLLDK
ncbi:MAG: ATP-dependent DNA helicase RecG [Halanaerobiales bacterium]|nr:ATP-dependent DNA helicase RecG [Halanaerobiales bacterium]